MDAETRGKIDCLEGRIAKIEQINAQMKADIKSSSSMVLKEVKFLRELFTEKLDSNNEQVKTKLESIEKKVDTTNGSVAKHSVLIDRLFNETADARADQRNPSRRRMQNIGMIVTALTAIGTLVLLVYNLTKGLI